MPYIDLDGDTFYYAGDAGRKGVPVVFCHGSGGGHHHWLYQIKQLPDTINPLAVDLPGHGRSKGSTANNVAVYRDWLHNFREVLGLESFVLAGHSLGGAVALDYALHYSSDLLGLILVGTGGRLKVLPSFLETLQKGRIPTALSDYLYGPDASEDLLKKGKQEVENTAAEVYLDDLTACDKFDIMEEMHRIKRPALVICGSEDLLTPVKYSRYLENILPLARLEVVMGAGHMVMIEKPQAVNKAITGFIEEMVMDN